MKLKPFATAVFVLFITSLLGFLIIPDATIYVDEFVHHDVAQSFCHLQPDISPNLTNIPAYHALIGGVCYLGSWITPLDSLASIRIISLVFSLLGVYIFYLLAQELKHKNSGLKTLQFFFLPIALPFYFFVYTDIPALTIVLAAFYLVIKKRYHWAGVLATLSVAFRQNNIVWLGWLAFFIFLEEIWPKINFKTLWQYLKQVWIFILGIIAFAGFIYWNGGISLAKAEEWAHPSFSLYLGNVYLMLITFTIIFWPLELDLVKKLNQLWQNKWRLGGFMVTVLGLFVTYQNSFTNSHPYNQHTFALHNLILVKITENPTLKLIAFIPIVLAVLVLFTRRLRKPKYGWFYLFAVLFVLPSWLIEPRYFFLPFALYLLFREKVDLKTEWRLIVWEVVLALSLFGGTITKNIFP